MTRDGLVEQNLATGEETRISRRGQDFDLRTEPPAHSSSGSVRQALSEGRTRRLTQTSLEASADSGPDAAQTPEFPISEDPRAGTERTGRRRVAKTDSVGGAGPDDGQRPEASRAPQPEKLRFSQEETPPAAAAPGKKLKKAQSKAEHSAIKLEAAKRKLPKKHSLKVERSFDAETGKPKRRLRFEEEVKTQAGHLKGPLPLRPVKAGANAAIGYAHKKIRQVERENVGVEAAHKGERLVEGATRRAYRFHRLKPYRRVAKLEQKTAKRAADLTWQKTLRDNPRLQSNLFSRMAQKRKIKKQYAKAAGDARRAAKRAKKAGAAAARATKAVAGFVCRHPFLIGAIALVLLVVFLFSTLFVSCSNMGGGGFTSVIMSSYTSEDEDLVAVDAAYTHLEAELEEQINTIPNKYPGMDEYRYQLDYIGHDPHELAAYLTSVFQTYTLADVSGELRHVFDLQYTLTITEIVEVRYRTETRTDSDGNRYTVRVPYNWYILSVTLENHSVGYAARSALTAQQLEMYAIYRETKGNKPLVFGGGSGDYSPSADLSGVRFVDGQRPGNMDIVNIALSQVGNVGGQPYWSWYGFDSRVEWCACFVSWCINQAGYSEPRFAGCTSGGMGWFSSHGQWADRNYTDIAPGDLIFFDWDLSGDADHVGIVIGKDGTHVYTVEGNSGDACRVRSYPLGSSVIRGYGLMNW